MMENRIYTNDEVASFIGFDLGRLALSTWPSVTLPEPVIAQAAATQDPADALDGDVEEANRAHSGFRTEWGVTTVGIDRDDGVTLFVFKVYLNDDPWLGGSFFDGREDRQLGCYLSDLVAPDIERHAEADIRELSGAGAEWIEPESVCQVAEFRGYWSDDDQANEEIRALAPLFAAFVRKVDIMKRISLAVQRLSDIAPMLSEMAAILSEPDHPTPPHLNQ